MTAFSSLPKINVPQPAQIDRTALAILFEELLTKKEYASYEIYYSVDDPNEREPDGWRVAAHDLAGNLWRCRIEDSSEAIRSQIEQWPYASEPLTRTIEHYARREGWLRFEYAWIGDGRTSVLYGEVHRQDTYKSVRLKQQQQEWRNRSSGITRRQLTIVVFATYVFFALFIVSVLWMFIVGSF